MSDPNPNLPKGPYEPPLMHPSVVISIDMRGYIVMRWKDFRFSHIVNYHIGSSVRCGWSSAIRKDK